jgi:DnaJ-like protein C11, C-terminal
MATPKKKSEQTPLPSDTRATIEMTSPLIFISHDTRDADLAEAFSHLLTDASGGVLQSFRSSDRKGTAGIEFGSEWYAAIMSKLSDATDVVALLTSHSLERPWILYEAGVAKGKLGTTVFGLAINIPLEKTNCGPFAQFQNCADDEDSLTKLILQLIRRNPHASPREQAVRRHVQGFQATIKDVVEKRAKSPHADTAITIRSAHYGTGASQIDVTDTVRQHVQDGTLRILATNRELCGGHDPAIGHAKGLTIAYTVGNHDRTITILEGTAVVLP